MPRDTEEYVISCGLKNALYSIKAADLKEDLFGPLMPCLFQVSVLFLFFVTDKCHCKSFDFIIRKLISIFFIGMKFLDRYECAHICKLHVMMWY